MTPQKIKFILFDETFFDVRDAQRSEHRKKVFSET